MTKENQKLTKYANTPMTEEMFKAITNIAWSLKITRSEYMRNLATDDIARRAKQSQKKASK